MQLDTTACTAERTRREFSVKIQHVTIKMVAEGRYQNDLTTVTWSNWQSEIHQWLKAVGGGGSYPHKLASYWW